ncbi:acetylornithine deacetylase [Pseudotabrizicola alkalilacus]|uniref:Acetylornithine deacetylase n=1 Tax=Pseudotabrizicola alkalilacus TaxID=2305252 RepID=A0A411YY43_9RHOB|nr:acetylornithine deacetylase [Pseudotabrizicola alkalilacus]RGP35776.1 acetylornithine deacetylase [Pseudotabrizicola alkalilacus]
MTPTETWLSRLIAHPTVSSDTNLPLMDEVEQALTALGAVCTRFPDATGQKAALLARLGPDGPGGLMLSGHVDVVPVTGQDWTVPPFQMTREGDRLYGRGSTDMKGFIAAMLALAGRAPTLRHPLWLAISYDEEVGCIGVRPMLAALKARNIRPDLVVVGEPTSMRLGLGHKGKLAFTVTAKGIARHSSEAPLALNALHLAADFMTAMRALQDEIAAHGPAEDGYSVPHATVHVGRLTGGTVVNLVPDSAELLMELRLLAADDPAALTARLHDLAAQIVGPHRSAFPAAALTVVETGSYPGLSTPLSAAVHAFATCLPPGTRPCKLSYGTEGGLFAQALGVPVVVCGPGDMAQGHRPDEYIEAAQLAACDAALDAALVRFCLSSEACFD